MAIKKFPTLRLGVICDSWAANRKLGGLPTPTCTPICPLRVIYKKIPPQIGGCSYFFIEKSAIKTFLCKNLGQDMILIYFVRKRSRFKNIFTLGHFELYLFKVLGIIYTHSHPD
jgi:hypothetical protein